MPLTRNISIMSIRRFERQLLTNATAALSRCAVWSHGSSEMVKNSHEPYTFVREGDETCPFSTGGGTRRVQLVREGRGGGGDTAGTWERSEVVAMMSTLPFASSAAYLNAG